MAQNVTVKFRANTADFNRGVKSVKTNLSGVQKAAKAASQAIKASFAAAAASVTAAGVAITRGIVSTLRKGSELSDVGSALGMGAGDVLVLQQAFKNAGISIDKVKTSMSVMAKSVYDANLGIKEKAEAFEDLGLAVDELQLLTPLQQISAIGDALAKVENPTKRTAIAMRIFGRSGSELITLFTESGAFSRASRELGGMVDIFNESSNKMDKAADNLANAGNLWREFTAGFTVGFLDDIVAASDKLTSIDMTDVGRRFAESLKPAYEAVKRIVEVAYGILNVGQPLMFIFENIALGFNRMMQAIFAAAERFVSKISAWYFNTTRRDELRKKIGEHTKKYREARIKFYDYKQSQGAGNMSDEAFVKADKQAAELFRRMEFRFKQLKTYQDELKSGGYKVGETTGVISEFFKSQADSIADEIKYQIESAMSRTKIETPEFPKIEPPKTPKTPEPKTSTKKEEKKESPQKTTQKMIEALKPALANIASIGGAASLTSISTIQPMVDEQRVTNALLRENNRLTAQSQTTVKPVFV